MNINAIRKKVHKIAPTVNVEEYRGCVRLTGELDDWDSIYRCGVAAVSKRSLGVLNDIKLKGFSEKVKVPSVNDSAIDGATPDVLVIGGGITGCAIARELSKLDISVMLVEKPPTLRRARLAVTTAAFTPASTCTKDNRNSITSCAATKCIRVYAKNSVATFSVGRRRLCSAPSGKAG